MTHLVRLSKVGLILILALAGLHAISTPKLVSAADIPTQISEDASITSDASTDQKSGLSKFFSNIGNGFRKVGRTVAGWFTSLGRVLGLGSTGHPEGAVCEEVDDCASGLICLNTCFEDEGCEVFEKSCTRVSTEGSASVSVKPLYASCGGGDLCVAGTDCTRTCPKGVECEVTSRCLLTPTPHDTCTTISDCADICEAHTFPPIGPSGLRPVCTGNGCVCQIEEVQPTLRITACTGDTLNETIVCPDGMRAACTKEGCTSGNCPVRLTCLTAPAYGGQCLRDSGCAAVECGSGTAPFCDISDNKCRCKSTAAVTVSCTDESECQGISCPADQNRTCVSGVCTCEKKIVIEEDFVCTEDSQCPANCPAEFSPACVDSTCACQRVRENVPVSCTTVDECGGVSCPADFEKICLDSTCACTKTTLQ